MFDSSLDRTLIYRLASAYDCWGNRRPVRCSKHHGIWFVGSDDLGEPPSSDPAVDPAEARMRALDQLAASGRFTVVELETLRALTIHGMTIDEIAASGGCSRQAVLARVVGNSKGQGGLLKKARAVLLPAGATSSESPLPRG